MFSTFRVAGVAAAIAALCLHAPAAAAQAAPGGPVETIAPAPAAGAAAPILLPAPDVNIQNLATNAAPAATNVRSAVAPMAPIVEPGDRAAATRPAVATTGEARRSLDALVAEHAGIDTTDEQFECLASAVYFESRGEPLEGQLAVAEVILNRVASGRFRSTICQVVTQPSQFSFVRRGQIPQAPRSSAAWQRAVAIARIAIDNLHDVTGDDSLFFHATYVRPAWGRANARIARIGNHVFYR